MPSWNPPRPPSKLPLPFGPVDDRADVDRRGAVEGARQVGDLVLHAERERVTDADHRGHAPGVAAQQPGALEAGEAAGSGGCG